MSSRIIAVANQKGGVGKTTTCVNLAASLAASRRRVLLIDMDPQGNATMGCGVDKHALETTACNVILGETGAGNAIVAVETAGFWLLPGNDDLTAAEVQLVNEIGREMRLRKALESVRRGYDYVIVDCPPSINMLTINALTAADGVLIPMQCEYYALEGLSALKNTVDKIRETVNPRLDIEGLLRTMYDPRNNLSNEVSAQLILHFRDKVFRTVIPRNVRLAEAPSFGVPVLLHDRGSRGALAYLALADELIRRDEAVDAYVKDSVGAQEAASEDRMVEDDAEAVETDDQAVAEELRAVDDDVPPVGSDGRNGQGDDRCTEPDEEQEAERESVSAREWVAD